MFRPAPSLKNKRSRRGRKIAAVIFFALLAAVGFYNLLTGSWFITTVLFPVIGEKIKYNLAAEKIEISLLRGTIEAKDFRFGPGWEPIVIAPSIKANFSRRALMRGELKLYKVRADAPEVTVCRNQAGYYNVNKVRFAPRPPDPPGPTVFPEEPEFLLEAEDIKITNGVFRFYYISNDGVNEIDIDARNVEIVADRFGNNSDTNFTVALLGKLSTYSLDLNSFVMNLSCHAQFTPHLLPKFTAAVCDLTEISGVAGNVSLNNRTLHAEGEAFGENVLNELQVKFINVDITDKTSGLNTRVEVTGNLDFYPWLMTSTADFVPIDHELFNYLHNYLDLPLTDARLDSHNRFTLNYTDAVLDGDLALNHDNDQLGVKYNADWEIETDRVTVPALSAQLTRPGSESPADVADFSLLAPLAFNLDGRDDIFESGASPVIRLRLNKLDLKKLGAINRFSTIALRDGVLSADLSGIPDATFSSLKFNGWGIAENLRVESETGLWPSLNANFSVDGILQHGFELTLNRLDAVASTAADRLFELKITNGRINLLTGKTVMDAGIGGLREPLLTLPPLRELMNSKPQIKTLLSALSPIEMTAATRIDYSPENDTLSLGNTEAVLYSANRRLATAELSPTVIDMENTPRFTPLEAALKIDGMPLTALNRFDLPGNPVFNSGEISTELHADLSSGLSPITFTAAATATGINVDLNDRKLDTAELSATLAGVINDGQTDISNCDLQLSISGTPVLNASLLASIAAGGSAFAMDGEISNFNGLLLERLNIAKFRMPLSAAGTFHLNCRSINDFRYTGSFRAATSLPGKEKQHDIAISGSLDFSGSPDGGMAVNAAGLEVSGDEGELGQLMVTGSILPPTAKDQVAKLFIKSDRFDAQSILDLLDDTNAGHTHEPEFYFGPVPIIADVELGNVTWQGNIRAQTTGRMILHDNSLDFERFFIRLNGAEIRAAGTITGGGANQTSYNFHAETDDAELSTVFAPFMPDDANRFYAAVSNARLDISGRSLTAKGFWDTQTGTLKMNLAKVRLTHNLGGTRLGRVLLLPFSIIVNLQEFLPLTLDRITHLGEITGIFSRFYDNTGAVEFNDGQVVLRSADGRINIDRFRLTGSPVRQFTFSGSFGLGSKRELQLESLVEVMSMLIPVRIGGTIDDPQADYSGLAAEMFRLNAGSFLDTLNPLD